MIFPTLNFLLFYLVLWPTAWALVLIRRHRLHKLAIIVASYFFYAVWSWKLAFILLGCVLADWAAGRAIDAAGSSGGRRIAAVTGIGINLAVLAFFKYY